MKRLVFLAIFALNACAATASEPQVKVVTADLAAPVSCIPKDYPPAPAYTDTLKALSLADDFAARYQLLAANHGLRVAREALDEQTIDACRKAAPPK